MELHEAIAKVHEAMEGRYDLDGGDLYDIHGILCEMQDIQKLFANTRDDVVVYDLRFCDRCYQMTNHLDGVCQKCKTKKGIPEPPCTIGK